MSYLRQEEIRVVPHEIETPRTVGLRLIANQASSQRAIAASLHAQAQEFSKLAEGLRRTAEHHMAVAIEIERAQDWLAAQLVDP